MKKNSNILTLKQLLTLLMLLGEFHRKDSWAFAILDRMVISMFFAHE